MKLQKEKQVFVHVMYIRYPQGEYGDGSPIPNNIYIMKESTNAHNVRCYGPMPLSRAYKVIQMATNAVISDIGYLSTDESTG